MIGGDSYGSLSTIGRFDLATLKWTNAGDLVSARYGHNVIYDGHYLLVVGGVGKTMTEKCSVKTSGEVSCTSQTPQLNGYVLYPEMFIVPGGYCEETVL